MRRHIALILSLGLASLASACGSPSAVQTGGPASSGASTGSTQAPATTQALATPASTPTVTSTGATAECGGSDVAAALRAASAAQNAAKSYRVAGTIVTTAETEALLEIQKPDRFHAKFGEFEFVAIGDDTWRNVQGTWVAAPGTDVQRLIGGMGQLDAELIASATFTNTTVQDTTTDGAAAIEYTYHESIPGQLEADVQLWLDPATCRPIHNVATGTATDAAPTFDVTYSGWDAVTVEAPE